MPDPRMPNFFVIGANRAGTTSLHEYLDQHPDVYMSPRKEPNYFAPKSDEERALWPDQDEADITFDEYRELFAGATTQAAIGESSTVYLTFPGTAARIRDAVPDARLVAVLRNPVDRAFSDWSLHRKWGTEPLSFPDAVRAELGGEPVGGRMRGYVLTGFYARSLAPWLEQFPRDRLQIHLYEDLAGDTAGMLRDVFAFLGVDPAFRVDTLAHRNASTYEVRLASVDRIGRSGVARAVRKLVPARAWSRARDRVRRANSVRPEIPDELRAELVDRYRDDILRTEEIVGRDLSAWRRS